MRILLAEDNLIAALAIADTLEKEGDDVTIVRDGAEAIDHLNQYAYDLLITDIMMPHKDGYEVIQHVRDVQKNEDLPILVQTALDLKQLRVDGERINGVVLKPFDRVSFIQALSSVKQLIMHGIRRNSGK